MTIEEFYTSIDASYAEVMGRLLKDDRIKKYLVMFSNGTDYSDLLNNLDAENYTDAFRNIHSIKGMSLNLGLQKLAKVSSELCEELRNGKPDKDISKMLEAVKKEYEFTVGEIGKLD